jgi:thiol-disulfide isomerase/thioredoxin
MTTYRPFFASTLGLCMLVVGSVMAQQPAKKAPATRTIIKTIPAKPAPVHKPDMHIKPGGINFSEAPIEQVFEQAKQLNKPIFVEIYSPDCHVCQSFIPILSDKKIGTFYNQNFVNARLPLESKATQAWLEKHKLYIPSLPIFLFFSPDGKVAHVGSSNPDVDMVLNLGAVAADPTYRGGNYAARYQNGDRDPNFLIDYGYFTKLTRDTTTNIKVMEEYARQQPADFYGTQISYLVLFKIIMDVDNPLTQHLINNIGMYKKYENPAANLPAPI